MWPWWVRSSRRRRNAHLPRFQLILQVVLADALVAESEPPRDPLFVLRDQTPHGAQCFWLRRQLRRNSCHFPLVRGEDLPSLRSNAHRTWATTPLASDTCGGENSFYWNDNNQAAVRQTWKKTVGENWELGVWFPGALISFRWREKWGPGAF